MPLYNYVCLTCKADAESVKGDILTDDECLQEVVFETSHSINPSEEELKEAKTCPRCECQNTQKTFLGNSFYTYVRGYGYLDRSGVKRDMHYQKLIGKDDNGKDTDPYAGMRQAGEKDDLAIKLKRMGKSPSKQKHYIAPVGNDVMNKAVSQAVNKSQ